MDFFSPHTQSAQFLSQLEEFSSQYSLGLSALKNLVKTVLIISLSMAIKYYIAIVCSKRGALVVSMSLTFSLLLAILFQSSSQEESVPRLCQGGPRSTGPLRGEGLLGGSTGQ